MNTNIILLLLFGLIALTLATLPEDLSELEQPFIPNDDDDLEEDYTEDEEDSEMTLLQMVRAEVDNEMKAGSIKLSTDSKNKLKSIINNAIEKTQKASGDIETINQTIDELEKTGERIRDQ